MDVIENEDNNESIITLEDFPFICRICCLKRSDLRLFEEEDYLFDLFHIIRKIDACSRVTFPRNICNGCINKLEDTSLFIDISKYSNASFGKNTQPNTEVIECAGRIESGMSRESREVIEENGNHLIFQRSQICRFCSSSSSSLTPFEEKSHLIQLFQNITNIDLKVERNSSKSITICRKCNNELEKVSSFVSSSLCNDKKLEYVIGTENIVKTEYYSKPIDTEFSTSLGTRTEDTFNKKSFSLESKEKLEFIDVTEEIVDSEHETYIEQNYQKKLKFHFRNSPERKLLEGGPSKETLVKEAHLSLPRHTFDIDTQNGEKPFKCDFCEIRFGREYNMKRHMITHTGEKLFKCDSCEKGFYRTSHLEKHKLTHREEEPFKCDCCDKVFYRKSHLKKHKQRGKKAFKCGRCKKYFFRKSYLKKHKRSHRKEKIIFKCDSCNKGFIEMHHLQQHLLAHTEEGLFGCECCEKRFLLKQSLQKHYAHSHKKVFTQ